VDLFRFIPGYETFVYEAGREPIFVALVAFLICFVFTRGYTRMARIRGWGSGSVGGVHLHHIVVGIVLALTSGALIIGFEPIENFYELLLCAVFGAGAAMVLDEFALVFHLEDVYWSDEGRSSIDAVIIALTVGVLVLLHVIPFDDKTTDAPHVAVTIYLAIHILLVLVVLLKAKFMTALFSMFMPFVAVVGAVRLAKPHSPWSRLFYKPGSRRRLRAEARQRKHDKRWGARTKRVLDVIGGAPNAPETD
jgi:hypothetical protein